MQFQTKQKYKYIKHIYNYNNQIKNLASKKTTLINWGVLPVKDT